MSDHFLITREHAIAAAQNAVRQQGYAVVVHGSKVRDLDLVAVPWQETALSAQDVAEIIAAAIPGVLHSGPTEKPHGRVALSILPRYWFGFDRGYVDLSVMPRIQGGQEIGPGIALSAAAAVTAGDEAGAVTPPSTGPMTSSVGAA